jgi:hypothetical protein
MWFSQVIPITAGTPIRLAAVPTLVQRLRITPLVGAAAGLIYVLSQDPAETAPVNKNANNFITELAPATATVPGQMFVLDRLAGGPPINLQEYAVDGSHDTDPVLVSFEI